MIENIKSLDIYGKKVSLTINNQTKVVTLFGAALTIMTFIIMILSMYYFGLDLYHRKNPQVTSNKNAYPLSELETFSPNQTDRPKNVIVLAFDIGFEQLNSIVVQETLPGSNWQETRFTKLPFCDQNYVLNEVYGGNNATFQDEKKGLVFYCVNTSNYYFGALDYFGGSTTNSLWMWTVDCRRLKYRDFDLDPCGKSNLTSMNNVAVYVNYQNVYFNYDNFEKPFSSFWVQSQFSSGRDQNNYAQLSLQRHNLTDDSGWLISNSNTTMEMGGSDFFANYVYDGGIAPFFHMTFQIGYDFAYTKYTRRYMKIQEVFASVGGIMKAIMILFHGLSSYYAQYALDITLLQKTFKFQNKAKEEKSDKKLNLETFMVELNSKTQKATTEDNMQRGFKFGVNNFVNSEPNLSLNKQHEIYDVSDLMTFSEYLTFGVLSCCSKKKFSQKDEFFKMKIHPEVKNIISLENFIRRFKEIDIFKILYLNHNQRIALSLTKNPDALIKEESSDDITNQYYDKYITLEEKTKKIIQYFKDLKGNITERDLILLRNMDSEIFQQLEGHIEIR